MKSYSQKADDYLKQTELLKEKIRELHWHPDDVRHGFYGLLYSAQYDYYLGNVTMGLAEQIGKGKVFFKPEIFSMNEHIRRLEETSRLELLRHGFNSTQSRNLILSSWTSFETCVNLLFNFISTEEDRWSLVKQMNNKLTKAISHLESNFQATIMELLRKSTFIPLIRKYNFIVKRGNHEYPGNLKSDREFLELLGTMRNCLVHSNGIYHGKPKEYSFMGTSFIFPDNEIFKMKGTNEDIDWDLSVELMAVFERTAALTSQIAFVPYPSETFDE